MAQQQIKRPPHSGGAECRNRFLVGPAATGCRLAGGEGDRGEETVPGGCIRGRMAYRGSRPGGVGHGWTEDKHEDHMIRSTLTQNACLWDFRYAESRRVNYRGIHAISAVYARSEVERGALGSKHVSSWIQSVCLQIQAPDWFYLRADDLVSNLEDVAKKVGHSAIPDYGGDLRSRMK